MTRTGKFRWMGSPDREDLRDGTALLRITVNNRSGEVSELYWVFSNGRIHRLQKKDGTVYQIRDGKCDCPDSQRGSECKHARALTAALSMVK